MRLPCIPFLGFNCAILALHTAGFAQHAIVINEIHYNPDVKTEPAEFIELYNAGAGAVDLGGWHFSDGIDYVFPATNVPPGGFVVVAQNPAAFTTKFGIAGALGPFNTNRSSQLDKFGEQIVLRDRLGSVADQVTYQLGFPWPTVGDAPGYSIELINPWLDNDLGGSWRRSVSEGASQSTSQTFINGNSTWRYVKGTSEASTPSTAWRHPNFNDTAWLSAPAPIGYGESFVATPLPDMSTNYSSIFLRRSFVVDDLAAVNSLLMEVLYDDAFKIWINGTHVRSSGLPDAEVPYNTFAATAREDLTYNLFTVNNPQSFLVSGTNIIAIQAHNAANSSDFFIDLRLRAQTGPAARGPTPGRINSAFATNAPPQTRQVEHTPREPRSSQPVLISAKVTDPGGVASVVLDYQLVDPGSYIELADTAYTNNWLTVSMNDSGTNGDLVALDAVYSVSLPPAVQLHRRLVRYRITVVDNVGQSVRLPYADDPQPNFAYFVYDGVPPWRGAVQPGATSTNGQVVTFPGSVMGRLPTFHLIGRSNTVAAATWFSRYTGDAYPWVGTLVYDGRVYDHIHYRARGGVWRYSMVKNMWKFDFNRGHDFEARDNWGRKYEVPWRKLNLGACIQQGNFDHRGEQGMFESVGFRLFNLAGVESPNSTFATLRVIDDANEADPASQYEGDFWGIFLAIEQEDGRFLDEHGLPDGNLYKMEGGTGELNNTGPNGPTDKSDLNYFLQNYTGATEQWWRTNLNVGKYVSYQAMVQAIHHYDICYDKNFFYFRDPTTRLWEVHSWDFDLTWADNMYDAGCGGKDRIYPRVFEEASPSKAGIQMAYRNRVREVRDLLWNTDQAWTVIDEYAALLRGPTNGPTILDADRAMWDYNPKMSNSAYTPNPSDKAGVGRFYQFPRESATNAALRGSFNALVQIMRNYVNIRGAFLDNIAADSARPNRPTITYTGPGNYPINRMTFRCSAFSSPTTTNTFGGIRWRVGEVTDTNSPSFNSAAPRKYEIETVWDSGPIAPFAPDITIPANVLRAGSRYRVRAQFTDNTGRNSNWSLPFEFTCGEPETAAELITYLRITEIMYNPPIGGYEYVELHNSSAALTLDLTGVKFTQGIDFTFAAGTSIPPGGYLLLVNTSDFAAFRAFYGIDESVMIVGPYSGALNNAGEQVTLRTAAGGTDIVSFTYNDGRGWPATDGTGHSLVLLDGAESAQNSGSAEFGGNWRSSTYIKGSPGRGELPLAPSIVLNEIVSNTGTNDLTSNDWIELYNLTDTPITLGAGWYLSDDSAALTRWMIPPATVVPPRGWISFDEQTGFHNPTNIGFALSRAGEQVFLSHLPGTAEDRVVDSVSFKAQDETRSLGRFPDGTGPWFALPARTRDASNASPELGVVITEIMYHPPDVGGTNDNSLDEFIELHNPTATTVSLFNTNGPWRLDGIGFALPGNLVLDPGAFLLVVNFDPATNSSQLAAFRSVYALTNESIQILGPYVGKLANSSERLSLEAPQATDIPGDFSWLIIDEVLYADQAPWPCGSDGTGASLQRLHHSLHGSDPANWSAQAPTPGAPRVNEPAGAPTITAQPADRVAATNTTVSFTVGVCGTPPFSYRWQRGETDIPYATNVILTLTNVQLSQSGEYRVIVSNDAGASISRAAVLIVQLPPVITEHPESRTVLAGQTAVLSVSASGTPPFSYQWLFHGSNILGATDRVLVLTNVQAAQAGIYSVIVQNSAASLVSSNALLTINVPPLIINQPQSVSTNPGASVVLSVVAEGSSPLHYQWFFEGEELLGQTNSSLSLSNVQLDTHNGLYAVSITNNFGSVLSSAVPLTVLVRPTFTQHPVPVTAAVGTDVGFTAVVAGTRPHTFRWRKGNTFLANGIFTVNTNNSTLAIPNVQPADAANYSVFVTNAAGNSGLGVIVPLIVVAPPTNRTAQPGSDVTLQISAFGPGAIRYQWRFNGADIIGATNTVLVRTNIGVADRGVYTVVVINSSNMPTAFSAVLNVSLPDRDGDGIPDEWEDANRLNADEPNDAAADADNDRMTNWQEYISGTDPQDPQSHLRIDYISAQGNGVTLTFRAITNRLYILETSDTLSSNGWIRWRDIEPSGVSNRTVHLYDGSASSNRAYRVVIPPVQ